MKFIIFLFAFFLIFPAAVHAHLINEPPYFKINNVFTDFYPVPSTSYEFNLPQDISKENFLVGQEIPFEIETEALPIPQEIIAEKKFLWDFGDGEKAEGLKNTHSYSKMGTYIITIYADSQNGFEPQILQTTAINILPDVDYKLPKSVIKANNKTSANPSIEILKLSLKNNLNFDASLSVGGSSEITEYFWDTGDTNFKNQKTFTYNYPNNPYIVFPILRIKTKDCFIADSYVQIMDTDEKTFNSLNLTIIFIGVLISAILTFIIFGVYIKFFKK